MMINQKLVISILSRMKKECDKRDYIRDYGVDLINYQNEFYETTMDLLLEHLGHKYKTDIEWWLFENVDKEVIINDITYNVEKAEDFFYKMIYEDYLISKKEASNI